MKTKYYFLILSLLFFIKCATPSAPTGGPRDTEPPKLVSVYPTNLSTNFTSKIIDFVFDEYVSINKSYIKITPKVEDFKVSQRRNTISIEFKDSLKLNTTYQINFGNKILDVNESNPLTELTYVFSTGSYIDSLMIMGKVLLANPSEAISENTYALIYRQSKQQIADSLFRTQEPDYFSPVSTTGNFEINFLSQDTFFLYLLSDNNLNFYYDLPTESIGFQLDKVVPSLGEEAYKMTLFIPTPKDIKFSATQRKTSKRKVSFESNQILSSDKKVIFRTLDSTCTIKQRWIVDNKYEVYFYPNCNSTQKLIVSVDSLFTSDTFSILLVDEKQQPIYTTHDFVLLSDDAVCISVDLPFVVTNQDSSLLLRDSILKTSSILPISSFTDSTFCFKLPNNTKPSEVSLLLNDSTLLFHNTFYNDTASLKLNVFSSEQLGLLSLSFEGIENNYNYIVHLLDSKKVLSKVVYVSDNQLIVIKNLKSGTYYIHIIEDKNMNKLRDMGSFDLKELPERLFVLDSPINIKANWEVEQLININSLE